MKRTSFRMMEDLDSIKEFLNKYLPSYNDDEIEIVEENNGYTIYVIFDDTNIKMKELEECFMHVMMLDSYLDAWNYIQQYCENL